MNLGILSLLHVSNVSVLQNLLCLCDTLEELVALPIKPVHIWHLLDLFLTLLVLVGHVVELNEVLWEDQGVVKDEPESLLLIVLFCSEHTRHMVVHLGVNLGIAPDLSRWVARVEMWIVCVLYALWEEDFTNEELSRGNRQESSLWCNFRNFFLAVLRVL